MTMQTFSTPMMKQYQEIKKEYADCMLFFRMGDFYELFMEDAHIGSRILGITLTSKAGGKDGKIPMAGVPYHAADTYIAKLVRAGYKVAICEQLSPPNKKGLVKRGVVRIVTPGTLIDEQSLERKEHNYIVSLTMYDDTYALAVADISTGYFAVAEDQSAEGIISLQTILQSLQPSECLLPDDLYNDPDLLSLLTGDQRMNIFPETDFPKSMEEGAKMLKKHFALKTLEGFGISDTSPSLIPASALLSYLSKTQNGNIHHIKTITRYREEDGLLLDRSTMINLELFSTIRDHETKGSLLSVIDQTITPMGGRLLKTWLKLPLSDKEAIEYRLDAVAYFSEHEHLRTAIREKLKRIPDIERILARLSVGLGNARDVLQLKTALSEILELKNIIESTKNPLITSQEKAIVPELETLCEAVETLFVSEPPLSVKDGGIIRDGVDEKLDQLRLSIQDSTSWITTIEKKERARTGINSLKVKYNKVFGYYIEISKANLHLAPKDYLRKQTLVNAERFITEDLKRHEEIILTATEKINEIEYKIFLKAIEQILTYTESIQKAAHAIAVIDVITNFSYLAEKHHYTKPVMVYSGELRLKEARHPVVEQLTETPFVPNDITLDNTTASLLLITGPNMAGKSVLIRQVALIVLLAHIGSFVPAKSAHISIVDKIFVRSGASDFITSGLSTFMVEMVETARIINMSTSRSLIIMDEIGRGTSTYDGISIAWSVAEHFVTNYTPPPKVLFATHYHELQALEEKFPSRIKNFHMAVAEQNGDPVFLHILLPGGASHSFGIAVAKLAGIPENVISHARKLLSQLEKRHIHTEERTEQPIPETANILPRFILKELENLDIANMTPLDAMNKLAELKEKTTLSTYHPHIEKD